MKDEIAARVERAIAERVFPGCVIGIVRAGGEREIFPFGRLTYDADAPAVAADTIYDVASITKSIPTASLALMLAAPSVARLNLAEPVKKILPELQHDFDATVEDLLRYRVKGPQLSKLAHMSADEIEANVFGTGFDGPPGESVYTNLPAFLLGIIIERAAGEKLETLGQKYFFNPLGMGSTSFPALLPRTTLGHVVPTEIREDSVEVRGEPHDESARTFARAGRAVGHAGLFSTAPDLLNFLEALLQGRFPHIVAGAEAGLGWQLNERFMGKYSGPKTFGKTGFTGTSLVADREAGIAFVILSNRTYPQRPATNDAINALRADVADVIFSSYE